MFYAGDAVAQLFGPVAVGQVLGGVINELGLNLGMRGQEKGKTGSIAECASAGKSQLPVIQL